MLGHSFNAQGQSRSVPTPRRATRAAAAAAIARAARPLFEPLEQRQFLSAGQLDPTFGNAGHVLADFPAPAQDGARAASVLHDGKLIVAGTSDGRIALARYNPDGTLDASFGQAGQTVAAVPGGADVSALAIQTLNDTPYIIVAGAAGQPGSNLSDFLAARFTIDGALDTTFGNNGLAITDFAGDGDAAYSALLTVNGGIVLGGYATTFDYDAYSSNQLFALAGLTSDGQLDLGFGSGGVVMTDAGVGLEAIASMTIDGETIIAAGEAGGYVALARYAIDGALDTAFGAAGIATSLVPGGASAVAVDDDGRILTAGGGYAGGFLLSRFAADGAVDMSFRSLDGNSGHATFPIADYTADAKAMAIDAGGRIVLAGMAGDPYAGDWQFAAMRVVLTTPVIDGVQYDVPVLDGDFGDAGQQLINVGAGAFVHGLALRPDGAPILAGKADAPGAFGDAQFALAALDANGQLDATLNGGMVYTGFAGSAQDTGNAVLLLPDGKTLVGGATAGGFALARYNPDGSPDLSFGNNGVVLTDLPDYASESISALLLAGDGFIAIANGTSLTTGAGEILALRYGADGALIASSAAAAPGYSLSARQAVVSDAGQISVVGTALVGSSGDIAIVRFAPDGTPDASFDGDGVLLVNIDAATITYTDWLGNEFVETRLSNDAGVSLALDLDGSLVVAASSQSALGSTMSALVLRIAPDGSAGTPVAIDFGQPDALLNLATSVIIDADGSILVGGISQTQDELSQITRFAVARLDAAGQVQGVYANLAFEGAGIANDMAVQPDGKILLAGIATLSGQAVPAIARYNRDGSPDLAFGTDGIAFADFGGWTQSISAIAIDAQSILAVGTVALATSDILLARFDAGPFDTSGGTGGPASIALQPLALYAADEGQTITLSAAATVTGGGGTATRFTFLPASRRVISTTTGDGSTGGTIDAPIAYAWDLDNDGVFEADGQSVPFAAIDDAIQTVRVRATSGTLTAIAATTVTVQNVAPTVVTLTGAAGGVRGQTLAFAGAFADPGAADTWSATVDFGDGTEPLALAGTSFEFTHAFAREGTYTLTLTVTDDDGGANSATHSVLVKVADIIDGAVIVGGTPAADALALTRVNGVLTLLENGAPAASFPATSAFSRIVIFAGDGDDSLVADGSLGLPVEFYGGPGDDLLNAPNAGGILVGGPGNDTLIGGQGRDLLVGSAGADKLLGQVGDDILVSGLTDFDADPAALRKIQAEWSRADLGYAARAANILAGAGSLANTAGLALNASTVHDDSGPDELELEADTLNGGAGQDLLFYNAGGGDGVRDLLVGNTRGEIALNI